MLERLVQVYKGSGSHNIESIIHTDSWRSGRSSVSGYAGR